MFKKLKQKIGEGAEKVVQQVNTSVTKTNNVEEGNLIDIGEPSTQSTPNGRRTTEHHHAAASTKEKVGSMVYHKWKQNFQLYCVTLDGVFTSAYIW